MAKNKTKWKIDIIVIECLLICALLGVIFVKKVEIYNFDEDATYFINGIDYEIPNGSSAKVNAKTKEITIISKNQDDIKPNGTIAYNADNSGVLMQDLILVLPSGSNADIYRLSYFSKIKYDNSANNILISRGNNENSVANGFLYDGADTYTLLEECSIEFEDFKQYLSPLSHVIVVKDGYIVVYDYQSKETYTSAYTSEVVLKDKKGKYTVNLSYDYIDFGRKKTMLHSFVDIYHSYFEESIKEQ